MEIKPTIVNYQSTVSAAGMLSSKILRQAERIEALEWSPNKDSESPRQGQNPAPTPQIKRERLVLSIKRRDGSEVLSLYA